MNILRTTFFSCLAAGTIMSCNPSPQKEAEKVEDAKEKLNEAQRDFEQATLDSINNYNSFRDEVNARIIENERQIALLKEKLQLEKKEIREEYEKQLEELRYKNEQLKIRMDENKEIAKDKWEAFKLSVNQDIDELGKSLSAMAQKNMKD